MRRLRIQANSRHGTARAPPRKKRKNEKKKKSRSRRVPRPNLVCRLTVSPRRSNHRRPLSLKNNSIAGLCNRPDDLARRVPKNSHHTSTASPPHAAVLFRTQHIDGSSTNISIPRSTTTPHTCSSSRASRAVGSRNKTLYSVIPSATPRIKSCTPCTTNANTVV